MRVELFGTLRRASEKTKCELGFLGEVDVTRVVQRLIDERGDELERRLLDPVLRSPLPNALILLNGVEINNLEGLRTPVAAGDVLTFLSITHGG
ncbi:MAG: MoaD/ThiS family protein [Candidatus Bathyarchaeota archaeon]|nr:MoaD/ThiS family protein [Candidatus Bathyarchaeota archaeon]